MKQKLHIFYATLLLALLISGCASEDQVATQLFVASFEKTSYKYSDIQNSQEMFVVFSETATSNGTVTIGITAENASYGVDFEITPAANSMTFTLPIVAGQDQTSFLFQNLIFPFDSDEKSVTFRILSIDYSRETNIQGYTTSVVSFSESLGGVSEPHIGGPNQGNQIYIDLSSETTTEVFRESWDLGFYCGADFRVGLNSSLYMAAKKLDATNIDAVTQVSVSGFFNQVAIGTFDPVNMDYVDDPAGDISGTAIDAISVNDAENHVYLVNLGYTVGTSTPIPGSVAVAGNPRGWKKIRVLRSGDQYILQYADLNSTSHQEIVIEKDAAYNFRFFSFNTNNTISVEPMKEEWDLNFTVFTNEIAGSGSYGYSDFVLNNLKGGAKAYEVNTSFSSYADFDLSDVNETSFQNDQRVIGADWRDVFSGLVYTTKFYILKDPNGIYYKIRMLGFLNGEGVRGYPRFEYALLN